MRKILSILLVLLWMFFIFVNSSATGEESGNLSGTFLEKIVLILTDVKKDSQEMDSIKNKYGLLIRKLAHFFVYFVLGILLMNALLTLGVDKNMLIYASLIGILYAISDEFHQTFVSGRSGEIRDVLLDSSATLMANYLFYRIVVLKCYAKKNN